MQHRQLPFYIEKHSTGGFEVHLSPNENVLQKRRPNTNFLRLYTLVDFATALSLPNFKKEEEEKFPPVLCFFFRPRWFLCQMGVRASMRANSAIAVTAGGGMNGAVRKAIALCICGDLYDANHDFFLYDTEGQKMAQFHSNHRRCRYVLPITAVLVKFRSGSLHFDKVYYDICQAAEPVQISPRPRQTALRSV